MGVAAYTRGSHAIRQALTATQRDPVFVLMEELNALEKYDNAGSLAFPATLAFSQNVWWLEGPHGASGYGLWYRSLREAIKRWRVALTGYDATVQVWTAHPLPPLPPTQKGA